MKPSSSIAAATACALTLAAAPALARGAAVAGFAASRPSALAPARLGPPRPHVWLSGAVHRRHAAAFGAYPVWYASAPSPSVVVEGDGVPAHADVRGGDIACVKPRIIELAPAASTGEPLPRVVYGMRPPCATTPYR
jgi:hypothetical protein